MGSAWFLLPALGLAALIVDALVGDPASIWRRLPHPVVIYGAVSASAERLLNRPSWSERGRFCAGCATMATMTAAAAAAGWAIEEAALRLDASGRLWVGAVIVTGAIHLAGRELHDRVADLGRALRTGDDDGADRALSCLVGRDRDSLDASGKARAGLESLAENASDGVVAPLFWLLVGGLPGIMAYKAINTADSMFGYRTARHRSFGCAAARLDDAVNWLPARMTAATLAAVALIGARRRLISASSPFASSPFAAMRRRLLSDAPRHASVNAGWPETAMATALGVALAGPRRYGGVWIDDPWMNPDGRRDAGAADIEAGLQLYRRSLIAIAAILAAAAVGAAWG